MYKNNFNKDRIIIRPLFGTTKFVISNLYFRFPEVRVDQTSETPIRPEEKRPTFPIRPGTDQMKQVFTNLSVGKRV